MLHHVSFDEIASKGFDISDEESDVAYISINNEENALLEAAKSKLTSLQREVLDLVTDGLSFREIGEKLGLSHVTVHEYYHMGIKKLKKIQEKFDFFTFPFLKKIIVYGTI